MDKTVQLYYNLELHTHMAVMYAVCLCKTCLMALYAYLYNKHILEEDDRYASIVLNYCLLTQY